VHVAQLLDPLLPAPDVEIIKPPLPATSRCFPERIWPQPQLIRIPPPSSFPPQQLRHALFQDLHHRGRRADLRLRDQQMDMLGHHHIANQQELITGPHLIENFQEHIPLPRRAQQGTTPVATAGNEMQMALPITALEPVLQEQDPKARTLCRRRKGCGTPNCSFHCRSKGIFNSTLITAVVSSDFVMRQAEPHVIRTGACRKSIGHPPAPRSLPSGSLIAFPTFPLLLSCRRGFYSTHCL
jgi:hypothetical protein